MNNTSSSKRVGIVIPTFNRSGYLRRSLIYLSNYFDLNYFEVFVADGSSETAHANENKRLCSEYGARYEYYSSYDYTVYQRIHDALCKLGTEYYQMLADDDFISSFAIKKCVAHLDKHDDCVAAFGHYVQFTIKQSKSRLIVKQITARSNCSYDQDCQFERLFWAMVEMPITSYYAVKRTKTEIATLSSVMEFDGGVCDFLIGDPLASSLTLLKGKVANIQVPYLCRQTGQSLPREAILVGDEMLMQDKNFTERYARARSIMLDHVEDGVDKELAGKAIDTAWGALLGGFCLSPARMNTQLQRLIQQMSSSVADEGPLKIDEVFSTPPKDDSFTGKTNSKQHNFTCALKGDEKKLLKEYGFCIPFISKYHQLTQFKVKPDRGFFWFGALEPRTVV